MQKSPHVNRNGLFRILQAKKNEAERLTLPLQKAFPKTQGRLIFRTFEIRRRLSVNSLSRIH